MTERTKTIKNLISEQVDMGTFGLVEIELLAIEKELAELRYIERETIKEEIRQWLIAEDFEGLAERL